MTEQDGNLREVLQSDGLVIIFNCAWHNPPGSPGREALEASLKSNEVISDGMCESCFRKQDALLDQSNIQPEK